MTECHSIRCRQTRQASKKANVTWLKTNATALVMKIYDKHALLV